MLTTERGAALDALAPGHRSTRGAGIPRRHRGPAERLPVLQRRPRRARLPVPGRDAPDGRDQHPPDPERVLPAVALGTRRRASRDGVLPRLALRAHGCRRGHRLDARRSRRRRGADRRRGLRLRARAPGLDSPRGAGDCHRDAVTVHADVERHLPQLRLRTRAVPHLRCAADARPSMRVAVTTAARALGPRARCRVHHPTI